jgi:hypothetical protein
LLLYTSLRHKGGEEVALASFLTSAGGWWVIIFISQPLYLRERRHQCLRTRGQGHSAWFGADRIIYTLVENTHAIYWPRSPGSVSLPGTYRPLRQQIEAWCGNYGNFSLTRMTIN